MLAVTSGCQSGGIARALSGMLPDHAVRVLMSGADEEPLLETLAHSEHWVTSLPRAETDRLAAASRTSARIIRIPNLYFHAFHPDIIHVGVEPSGRPLGSPAGEYSSAIVVHGWISGLSAAQIRARFSAEIFDRVGFFRAWDIAVGVLRQRFDESDVDFAEWFLPVARSGVFMLTDNHPSVGALIQLARQVAFSLGAPKDRLDHPWERVIPDGLLATSTVWPVYSEIAERLAVRGGYIWRREDGEILGLDDFIESSLDSYRAVDPAKIMVPELLRDMLLLMPRCHGKVISIR